MNKDKCLNERILIVDDENTVLLFLSLTLKQLGYNHVEKASNAAEGFEIAKRTKPALVIADIHMPGESGLELLKKIKDCMPDTGCIVITASDALRDAIASLNQGVDRYMLKPLTTEELQHAVTSSLEKRHLILENRQMSFHDTLTGLYNRRYEGVPKNWTVLIGGL